MTHSSLPKGPKEAKLLVCSQRVQTSGKRERPLAWRQPDLLLPLIECDPVLLGKDNGRINRARLGGQGDSTRLHGQCRG